MAMRMGGFRRKTRNKLELPRRRKGKLTATRMLAKFEDGEKVSLVATSSVQKGMYHPRFYGRTGVIEGKAGTCYKVLITVGNAKKTLIVHPAHLKGVKA